MNEPSLWQRLKTSLQASAGEVVFGMEDGTVSIFGLVFGVAATTIRSEGGADRRRLGRGCRRGVDDGRHLSRRRDR